jgi:hypothetical protein|nr:MAG TPA: nucelotide kinase [Caudoviricetes sp.]
MTDNINHPTHYNCRNIGYECILLAKRQYFCTGNVIKYLWRYKDKGNPIEDLKKARWYARKAAIRHEKTETSGRCGLIIRKLVASTSGLERAAWYCISRSDWHLAIEAINRMMKEKENNAQDE